MKTLVVETADGQEIPATNYDYMVIFYDAQLNENADIGLNGNENTAYLEFSNDPNGDGLGRTAEDTVIVFTYELDGTKVDGETQAALQNAQFVLLNGAKSEAAVVVDGKVTGWVKVDSEAAAGDVQMPGTYEEWVERYGDQNVILTSAADGIFKSLAWTTARITSVKSRPPTATTCWKRMCNWSSPLTLRTGRIGQATPQPPSRP